MSARQFSVRCTTSSQPASDPSGLDAPTRLPALVTERLVVELMIGGLEEITVVSDAQGERLTIRGRAPSESREAARALVEERIICAATLDLTILEPGVWIDERTP